MNFDIPQIATPNVVECIYEATTTLNEKSVHKQGASNGVLLVGSTVPPMDTGTVST